MEGKKGFLSVTSKCQKVEICLLLCCRVHYFIIVPNTRSSIDVGLYDVGVSQIKDSSPQKGNNLIVPTHCPGIRVPLLLERTSRLLKPGMFLMERGPWSVPLYHPRMDLEDSIFPMTILLYPKIQRLSCIHSLL